MTMVRGLHALGVAAFVSNETSGTPLGEAIELVSMAIHRDQGARGTAHRVGQIPIDLSLVVDEDSARMVAQGVLDGFMACVEVIREDCMHYTRLCIDRALPVFRDCSADLLKALMGGLELALMFEETRLETNCGKRECPVHGDLNGGDVVPDFQIPIGEC